MKGRLPTVAWLRRGTRCAALAALVAAAVAAACAWAFFAVAGSATASAGVGAINAPTGVTAQQTGADVTVSWSAATLSSGAAVQGYTVARSGGPTVCGSPTLVSGLSCTDGAVPGGTYTYTVTAVYNTFTKPASGASITVLGTPAITAKPSDPSANAAPAFSFSGGGGSAFACQLDAGPVAACTSPKSYPGTTGGSHTFRVQATQGAVSGPFATDAWTLSTAAPSITAQPANPSTSAAPSFSFSHAQAGYALQCKLDAAAFAACTSPKSYTGVAGGSHTFQVQALGGDGFATSAASYTWLVDATAPVASLPPAGGLIWANPSTNTIGRANLDGTGANLSLVTGAARPIAVAADSSFIYWINDRTANQTLNSIGRANLDGSSPNQNFLVVPYAYSVAVDGSYLYWTSIGHNTVGRANLNGTGFNNSFITGANGPTAMAISASHVVWPNINVKTIGRANIDGSGTNQTALGPHASIAGAVAVDSSYIYWTSAGQLSRANIDGTGTTASFIAGVSSPGSLAVDASHLYWMNSGGSIGRANRDGTSATQSLVTGLGSAAGLAIVPAPAGSSFLSGSTIYYNSGAAGSLTLTAAVTDAGSGPASATFPAIATSGWTHDAETVTSGSGTAPTIKYTSSAFSWTASPGTPSGYAVTGTDSAGNAGTPSALTFVGDATAPAGGAVSVNGFAAAGGGSTSTSASASFAINSRADYAEALSATQSSLRASTLSVQSATLTAGTCGAPGSAGPFTTPVTIAATTQPAGFVAARCYIYRLTGTDKVANADTISTTVQVP